MNMITNPKAIKAIQLCSVRSALKLELRTGLKHSKMNVRKVWAIELGLKPSAKIPEVIAELTKRIDAIDAELGISKEGV